MAESEKIEKKERQFQERLAAHREWYRQRREFDLELKSILQYRWERRGARDEDRGR